MKGRRSLSGATTSILQDVQQLLHGKSDDELVVSNYVKLHTGCSLVPFVRLKGFKHMKTGTGPVRKKSIYHTMNQVRMVHEPVRILEYWAVKRNPPRTSPDRTTNVTSLPTTILAQLRIKPTLPSTPVKRRHTQTPLLAPRGIQHMPF